MIQMQEQVKSTAFPPDLEHLWGRTVTAQGSIVRRSVIELPPKGGKSVKMPILDLVDVHIDGYDGEIHIIEDKHGKLVWECPRCGNKNQNKMNVARRTCGYIGTQFWNQGRTQEIQERVLHL